MAYAERKVLLAPAAAWMCVSCCRIEKSNGIGICGGVLIVCRSLAQTWLLD